MPSPADDPLASPALDRDAQVLAARALVLPVATSAVAVPDVEGQEALDAAIVLGAAWPEEWTTRLNQSRAHLLQARWAIDSAAEPILRRVDRVASLLLALARAGSPIDAQLTELQHAIDTLLQLVRKTVDGATTLPRSNPRQPALAHLSPEAAHASAVAVEELLRLWVHTAHLGASLALELQVPVDVAHRLLGMAGALPRAPDDAAAAAAWAILQHFVHAHGALLDQAADLLHEAGAICAEVETTAVAALAELDEVGAAPGPSSVPT